MRWLLGKGRLSPEQDGQPAKMHEVKYDITDRRRSEESLRETTRQPWQATRLAGVGELAASIAHELNNPLGTVSPAGRGVARARPPRTTPADRPLEVIEQEVERMAGLVGNLLQFSRAGRDQVSTVECARRSDARLWT